jgi:hypothetical protein
MNFAIKLYQQQMNDKINEWKMAKDASYPFPPFSGPLLILVKTD